MKIINYTEINWNNVDFTKLESLKQICRAIKDYFWKNRKDKDSSEMIVGEPYFFLIKVFEMYHTEWHQRIGDHRVIGFQVKKAKLQTTVCFHFVLENFEFEDSAISYSKLSKKLRVEADVKVACRTAIDKLKSEFKIKHCNGRCPVSNLELTLDNSVVHHYDKPMNVIIDEWVALNGGFQKVYKHVNPTIGGGTKTFFTDNKMIEDFINYHNAHTHMIVLHKQGHNMIHNKNQCLTKAAEERVKLYNN